MVEYSVGVGYQILIGCPNIVHLCIGGGIVVSNLRGESILWYQVSYNLYIFNVGNRFTFLQDIETKKLLTLLLEQNVFLK